MFPFHPLVLPIVFAVAVLFQLAAVGRVHPALLSCAPDSACSDPGVAPPHNGEREQREGTGGEAAARSNATLIANATMHTFSIPSEGKLGSAKLISPSVSTDIRSGFPRTASFSRSFLGGTETPSTPLPLAGSRRSYSNYLLHLPKAGGYSAFAYLAMDRGELSSVAAEAGEKATSDVCNHGGAPIDGWRKWKPCWLHSSESVYSREPARTFVVLRDPTPHVLSMWNYCTQSPKRRKKARTMPPTLDEWLGAWAGVQTRRVECPQFQQGGGVGLGCPGFVCFNPLDLQSRRTGLLGREDVRAALEYRFEVVGLTSQLERSTCLISIAIHGAVPGRCDCTSGEPRKPMPTGEVRLDHGVVSHGDDMNVTAEQLRAVKKITSGDARLYKAAESLFKEQVARVERRFKIKLC